MKNKKYTLLLHLLLMAGLLTHTIILWTINCVLNPADVSSQLLWNRLLWRNTAEAVFAGCSACYFLGQIVLLYRAVKKKLLPSWKQSVVHFIAQFFVVFACVVPFAILDFDFAADYLLPAWSVAGIMVILTVVRACCSLAARKAE